MPFIGSVEMMDSSSEIVISHTWGKFAKGDIIVSSNEETEYYKLLSIDDYNTMTVRPLRWYEKVWFWLKRKTYQAKRFMKKAPLPIQRGDN